MILKKSGSRLLQLLIINFSFFLFLSSCSVQKQIGRSAKKVIHDPALQTAHVGISIYEPATNTYWFNYQGDHYFVPASNTKIPTCYAAMKYLGDSLVAARISIDKPDNILVFPSGDPTFLNSEFTYQPLLEKLKQYKHIFLYQDQWKEERWGNGWSWNDYQDSYMAERSGFPIFGNLISFSLSNDTLQVIPKIKIDASLSLGYDPALGTVESKLFRVNRNLDDNDFFLSQSTSKFSNTSIPLRTDAGFISEILEDTLKAEVVPSEIAKGYSFNPPKIIIHSQPTDSLLKPMMHRSDNFFAEQSLLMVSNELLGYMNDEKIIDTLLKTDFKDLPQKPRWVDGSGLSRYNLFSPQDFVFIFNKMKNDFGIPRIQNILATGGTGTLSSYYKNEAGSIFAKTGTLSGVVSISGFLYTRKNKLLIFSVLVNNHNSSATAVRRAVEQFIESVREKY
ncbi:MAG: D-alanyl-D-alanine carboxypeptidase [Bacteroidetes bacterium]|nr:D-alanyl-D-alanine carboxypeptidase [Bacteroidota bacterium]